MRSRHNMMRILGVGLMGLVLAMTGCKKKSESSSSKSKDKGKTEARATARKGDKTEARGTATSNKPGKVVSVSKLATGPVTMLVGLDAGPLKKSPLWALVTAKLAEATKDPEYKAFVTTCKVDPVQAVSRVEIALAGDFMNKKGAKPDIGMVIHGNFDGPAMIKCLKTVLAKKNPTETTVAGKPALVYKDKKGETTYIIGVGKGTLALSEQKMSTLVASGDLISGSPRLKALKGGLPGNAFAWVLFGKIPLNAGSLGPFGAMLKGVKEIAGGSLYVIGTGAEKKIVLNADMGSADAANKLVKVVSMVKGLMAMQAGKLPPKAKPALDLLNKMNTKVVGTNLVVTIPVDDAAMKSVANMAAKK